MLSMPKVEKLGMVIAVSLCLVTIALMGELLRHRGSVMSGDQHLEAILVILMLPFPSLNFVKRYHNPTLRMVLVVITYVLILICIDLTIWRAGPQ